MGLREFFSRGPRHQELLDSIDIRVVVSGIRGKSSTVRRLHDILYGRNFNTVAKITGDFPITIENGDERPIDRRGPRVTLYENRTIIDEMLPHLSKPEFPDALVVDAPMATNAAVFENQAIREYTMRMFNSLFVKPQVVFFTNIRQDHNDTLGRTRQRIARSFARSIPEGTHVISGEQNAVIHELLKTELHKRDVTIEQVTIPDRHDGLIGAETIYGLNTILNYYDLEPLSDQYIEQMLASQQPTWVRLADGTRIFNAAKVNDIESTELFRRHLIKVLGDDTAKICPFVFLRQDRRGRTASFVEYINILAERELVDRVHVGGAFTGVFARKITPPTIQHDTADKSAVEVLDHLIEEEMPILLMANTVHPWMRALDAEIAQRQEPWFEIPEPKLDESTGFIWLVPSSIKIPESELDESTEFDWLVPSSIRDPEHIQSID